MLHLTVTEMEYEWKKMLNVKWGIDDITSYVISDKMSKIVYTTLH